jgi:hypothetical protein
MPNQIRESEAPAPKCAISSLQVPERREILRSLTKKQESFAGGPDGGMKPFAFIMAMRTAMPYDGIGNCGRRMPRMGNENPFHAVY